MMFFFLFSSTTSTIQVDENTSNGLIIFSGLITFASIAGFSLFCCFRPITQEERIARLQLKSSRKLISSNQSLSHSNSKTLSSIPDLSEKEATDVKSKSKSVNDPDKKIEKNFEKKLEILLNNDKSQRKDQDIPVIYDISTGVKQNVNSPVGKTTAEKVAISENLDLKLSPSLFFGAVSSQAAVKNNSGKYNNLVQQLKDKTSTRSVSCFTRTRTFTSSITIGLDTTNSLVISIPGYLKLDFEADIELDKCIGQGSTGNVRIGKLKNPLLKNDAENVVAVKIMDDADENSFKYETAILGSIPENIFVVFFVGYYEGPENRGLVTKLYDGDLSGFIFDPKVKISAFDAINIAHDIAQGMIHVHKHNIVHFDLKPKNIFVEYQRSPLSGEIQGFQCAIGDFGNSKLVGSAFPNASSKEGLVNGVPDSKQTGLTPLYSAPEILREVIMDELHSCQERHKKGDLYSYAITLLEVLLREKAWKKPVLSGYSEASISLEDFIFEIVFKGIRPNIPESLRKLAGKDLAVAKILEIIPICWDAEPDKRPTFEYVVNNMILAENTVE